MESTGRQTTEGWEDEDLVPLALLNQFVYCPRRAGLMAIDGVFAHNAYTLEGSFQHDRAHDGGEVSAAGVRVARALPLFNRRLGLVGKADIVEFRPSGDGEAPYPVEYKHGARHRWDNDDVQLCGQALCLEEMFGVSVPAGAVFHVASKRRREVLFDADLRKTTQEAVAGVRRLLSVGVPPPAVLCPRCDGCSLRPACMPEVGCDNSRLADAVGDLFRAKPDDTE
jgi:CRISPR-associated exonuclease Cas4